MICSTLNMLICRHCCNMSTNSTFILTAVNRKGFRLLHPWQKKNSARSSSSVAAYNSSVHREKHDKKDVWRMIMGEKTLLAYKGF